MAMLGLRPPPQRLGDRWRAHCKREETMSSYQWIRVVANDWEYTERLGGYAA